MKIKIIGRNDVMKAVAKKCAKQIKYIVRKGDEYKDILATAEYQKKLSQGKGYRNIKSYIDVFVDISCDVIELVMYPTIKTKHYEHCRKHYEDTASLNEENSFAKNKAIAKVLRVAKKIEAKTKAAEEKQE